MIGESVMSVELYNQGRSLTVGYRDDAKFDGHVGDGHCPKCRRKTSNTSVDLQQVYVSEKSKHMWFDRADLVVYQVGFFRRLFGFGKVGLAEILDNCWAFHAATDHKHDGINAAGRRYTMTVHEVSYLPAAGRWLARVEAEADDYKIYYHWWLLTEKEAFAWFYKVELPPPSFLLESMSDSSLKTLPLSKP